ncbi:MAG: NUDIX domain-containing protein [Austwickia sp.]|nr:NUDIX domain-containing protein [Actinomycetota bacterium]MCO5310867.1 NUDIX domain-containing protein [Austwickia sp.]
MSGARAKGPDQVRTAGVLPWRRRHGTLEVALVHRKRYDDWSWPKGKLDGGELWPAAALREAAEETGLRVRLGVPLPSARYPIPARSGTPQEKIVRYWAARPLGGGGGLRHEVDRMRWVSVKAARRLMTYRRDGEQLDALVAAEDSGALAAWPLLVVRHAHALGRKAWSKKDWLRPLDDRGSAQARDLVPVLAAYDVRRISSSSATRCIHTISPYAKSAGLKVHSTAWLSEEGYEDKPTKMAAIVTDLLAEGRPALVCSHGPVLPDIVGLLLDRSGKGAARAILKEAAEDTLVKGEALVVHVRGRGKAARVVAAERHQPLR